MRFKSDGIVQVFNLFLILSEIHTDDAFIELNKNPQSM